MIDPVYLGDSVYASFDGEIIALHLNSHEDDPVVFLNDEVMSKLNAYYKAIYEYKQEDYHAQS